MTECVITALYKFVTLDDYQSIREPLQSFCQEQGVKGTLLLANEGINGTVAGTRSAMDAVLGYLKSDERLADVEYKESFAEENPFYRMKVKLKREIVTLGVEGIDPNQTVGTYVKPQDWNALISDPDVVLVDTRNDYEVDIGTFKGAVDPKTTTFREFPEYVHNNFDPKKNKKVAMFCTGGIRCEKASAYMLQEGYEEVYHLQGGILKYLEEVPESESMWQGECFVFDNRVSVDHSLEQGHYDMCHACRRPISEQDKESPDYQSGVSCHHCIGEKSAADRERFAQRQQQIELANEHGQHHIGLTPEEVAEARAQKASKQAELRERSCAGQKKAT
jgi:UPF0176 protein